MRKKAYTLIEVLIVSIIFIIVLGALIRVFFFSTNVEGRITDKIIVKRQVRTLITFLRKDIREAVIIPTASPSFIVQDIATPDGKWGKIIRFARFMGLDVNGKPRIVKLFYMFDDKDKSVWRGVWSGQWGEDKDWQIVNKRKVISFKKGGFVYFSKIVADQYAQNKGRTYIVTWVDIPLKNSTYEATFLLGSRNVLSYELDPAWNDNPNSLPDMDIFNK